MECVDDVDDQYFIFENLLKDVINDHAPLKTKCKRAKEVLFMNRTYRKSIMNIIDIDIRTSQLEPTGIIT